MRRSQNRIRAIAPHLDGLCHLRLLNLSVNQLTRIDGLETLSALRSLQLSHNRIERVEGLDPAACGFAAKDDERAGSYWSDAAQVAVADKKVKLDRCGNDSKSAVAEAFGKQLSLRSLG